MSRAKLYGLSVYNLLGLQLSGNQVVLQTFSDPAEAVKTRDAIEGFIASLEVADDMLSDDYRGDLYTIKFVYVQKSFFV